MEKNCGNCRFWSSPVDGDFGDCRGISAGSTGNNDDAYLPDTGSFTLKTRIGFSCAVHQEPESIPGLDNSMEKEGVIP